MCGIVTLVGDEARHMLNVLRMKKGDRVILIDGSGTELTAVISETFAARDGRECEVHLTVEGARVCDAEPNVKVTLFQCLPKAGKMELIIQKCVELGVSAIRPVHSRRCVVKPERNENKLLRYEKVSQEASKQCGRATCAKVYPPAELEECGFSDFDLLLIAYEGEEKLSLKQALMEAKAGILANKDQPRIALLIGPAGGFEPEEIDRLMENCSNARSVSLGKRILRTETAGMAMLAMLMYELEE